jgi:hypothetical protein
MSSEDLLEDRDDLSQLLLNGLPPDEREHVINVIRQGDEEKLRHKRGEDAGEPVPAQARSEDDEADDDEYATSD